MISLKLIIFELLVLSSLRWLSIAFNLSVGLGAWKSYDGLGAV